MCRILAFFLSLAAWVCCAAAPDDETTAPTVRSSAAFEALTDGERLGAMSGARLGPLRCDAIADVVDLDGRCDAADHVLDADTGESRAARRIGEDSEYTTVIRLRGSRFLDAPERSFTFVRVRSDATWTSDTDNVLGTATTGVCVRAAGPLKGDSIGYAIRVRDRAGQHCRGYVSSTVADEFEDASR